MFGKRVNFAGMVFNVITNVIIFLVLKGVVRVFSDLQVYFFNLIINLIIF